jgi:hypothetical protein
VKQLLILSWVALNAAAQIRAPQMGFAGGADGTLRPVYGVAENFILGPSVSGRVISQAYSGSLGLLKTNGTLVAFGAQGQMLASIDAAPGPALFAFSPDGVTALAYVASSNTLVEWRGGKFTALPSRAEPGTVVAMAMPNAFEAELIIERNGGLWELRPTSWKALPNVTVPVLAIASGELLFSDANGMVLRKPDNSEVHITALLPSKFSLQQMDSEWVQLTDLTSARRFAVRILSGHEGFYQLPEAGQ